MSFLGLILLLCVLGIIAFGVTKVPMHAWIRWLIIAVIVVLSVVLVLRAVIPETMEEIRTTPAPRLD